MTPQDFYDDEQEQETDENPTPLAQSTLERKRKQRDDMLRSRLKSQLIPGLPVDADVPIARIPETTVGGCMLAIVDELISVKDPFYDTLCERWKKLFPDFPGYPGRYRDGHLFLYVANSGQIFTFRPRLAKMKKLLLTLPSAPKANRLSLHLEVRRNEELGKMRN